VGYDVTSLGNQSVSTFRSNTVSPSSSILLRPLKMGTVFCLENSGSDSPETQGSIGVRNNCIYILVHCTNCQHNKDAGLYRRITESSYSLFPTGGVKCFEMYVISYNAPLVILNSRDGLKLSIAILLVVCLLFICKILLIMFHFYITISLAICLATSVTHLLHYMFIRHYSLYDVIMCAS
jgi:hypothetical protein